MPTICWTKSFPDSPKQLRNLPLTVNKCRKNWFRNLLLLILNPSFFISPLRDFPFIADRMMTEMIMLSRLQQEFSGFPLAELSGKFISIKMNPPLFQNKLDSFEKKETILWRNIFFLTFILQRGSLNQRFVRTFSISCGIPGIIWNAFRFGQL